MSGNGDGVLTRLKELPPVKALGRRVVGLLDERERRRPALEPKADAWALERASVLDVISEKELVAAGGDVETHARRHTFVLSESDARVWIVLSGALKLCRVTILGQRIVEALLSPGDPFGRVASAGAPITYELQALERSQIASLPRAHFEALLLRRPELAYTVVQSLEDRQRSLVRRIEALAFKNVRARVAETLLELVHDEPRGCSHGFAVDVRITQQDLAELVGASRQMVNRVLGELSRELYLHRTGRVICILHRERLARLAAS